MTKKIFIKTLGCQMNEYDSNRIYDIAKKIKYERTDYFQEADCYVLNTCHIREKATDKVYHDVGRIKKISKNKKKPIVIIIGCVAQAEGELLLKREKYIDAVIGPQSYHEFNEILKKLENRDTKINFTDFKVIDKFDTLNTIKNSSNNISSFLTVQEGCDKFCKFCVVPYTRGVEYSRTVSELIKESEDLVSNGAREITLLGQNVNAYYNQGKKLSHLISEISKIKELKRIRYTTSHPTDFTKDLIEAHKNSEKLMPFVHLPVQSGSDKILDSMNRKHTIQEYLKLIDNLRGINPLIKFSSDFIIGYPGETDEDFNKTMELLNKVKFTNTYSYIFSPRPGTPASKLKQIEKKISKERLFIFQKAANEIKIAYRKNLFNTKSLVLFENKTKEKNEFFGRDETNNPVIVKTNENLKGKIKKVKIINGNQSTLFGEIYKDFEKKDFAA